MSRVRRPGLALLTTLAVLATAAGTASAREGALHDLREWGAEASASLGNGRPSDARAQREIARLRRLLPSVAGRLRTSTAAHQRAELGRARESLQRQLAPIAARLTFAQRWFFYTAYQAELERLAHWVGLLRAPTGAIRLPGDRPLSPAEALAIVPDGDADGRLEIVERDDDADGVPDRRDDFDHGWGIPDALQAREDADGDVDEDGVADALERPGRVHSPCVFVTDLVPAFRTVGGAARWLVRAERQRGCQVPRGAPRASGRRVGRSTRLAGMRLSRARIENRTLRLHVRARRAVRLSLVVLDGDRVMARGKLRRRAAGGSVSVRLGVAPPAGTYVLRLEAVGGGAAHLRAQASPPPLPTAVAFDPPVLQDDAFGLTSPPCTKPADSDKDGVPDCQETAGFQFAYYNPGQKAASRVAVTSDPLKPNTDSDAVTVGGATFALPDGVEWTSYLAGGTGNPRLTDSDSDALSDVEEHYRWATAINAGDTDDDSVAVGQTRPDPAFADGAELSNLPQKTSPTLADTDGDSVSDLMEATSTQTNPRVAQVPTFAVYPDPAAPGITISIPQATSTEQVVSTLDDTEERTEFTDHTSDEAVHEKTSDWHIDGKGGCGIADVGAPLPGSASCVPFGQIEVGGGQSWTEGTTHTHETEFSQESQRSAQRDYESSTHVELKEEGTLSAKFAVENTSPVVSVQIRSLSVGADAVCLPVVSAAQGCLGPGRVTPVATLTPESAPPGGITLAPLEARTLTFTATVATPLLQSLLANPGNLSFTPEGFELWTADGKNNYAAIIGSTIATRTGGLTIDYDDGHVDSYRVAVTVDRAWGAPGTLAGISADETLRKVLGIDYETQVNPPPAPQRRVLIRVGDKRAQPLGPNGEVPGAWFAIGSATGIDDPARDFDAIQLMAGSDLRLAFLADADADFLFDRQERLLGSSDVNRDTDGDSATGPRPAPATGNYASDYFEASVGWMVPYPSASQAYRAYASPVSCDGDGDASPDGPGPGTPVRGTCPTNSPYPPEAVRKTDPTDHDTNDDGLDDGSDPAPLTPPIKPVASGQWSGRQMQATNGVPLGEDGWWLRVGGEIRPPALALCGTKGAGPCANATGYYRLTWTLAPYPQEGLEVGPQVGHWRVASQEPGQPEPTIWMTALRPSLPGDMQRGGLPGPAPTPRDHELYFHLPQNARNVALTFDAEYTDVSVARATLEPISRQDYLAAAVSATGQPNPRFAGIAFPGQDLAQAKGTAPDGAQAIRIDGPAQNQPDYTLASWGPPEGLNIPAGGFRASFQMRIGNTTVQDDLVTTLGVTQGATNPPQETVVGGASGLTTPTDTRFSLVSGHLWRKDFFVPGALRVFNLFFDERTSSQNLSFPVTVSPSSGTLTLDHVVLDLAPDATTLTNPDPQGSFRGLPYSGLGFPPAPRLAWLAHQERVSFDSSGFARLFGGADDPSQMETIGFTTSQRWAKWHAIAKVTQSPQGSCPAPWFLFGNAAVGVNSWSPSEQAGPLKYAFAPQDQRPSSSFGLSVVGFECQAGVVEVRKLGLINRPAAPTGVAIEGGRRYTRSRRARLVLRPPPGATSMELAHDPLFRRPRRLPVRRRVTWVLQRGSERTPRRVFVRFHGAGVDPREVVTDAIFLDRTPPTGRATVRRTRSGRLSVWAVAADAGSGPAAMQVRVARRILRWRPLRRPVLLRSPRGAVSVRFRDRAGNVSPWLRERTR